MQPSADATRRAALKGMGAAALGMGALAFALPGGVRHLTPAQAKHEAVPFSVLTAHEAATLAAFGEALLPGAAAAGIANFVDHQLGVAPEDALLMLRYLDVPPPYAAFYRGGLAALDAHSKRAHGRPYTALFAPEASALIATFAAAPPPSWQGPPSPLFYLAVRADAVDVVYGTERGLARLGVPGMQHILPETDW